MTITERVVSILAQIAGVPEGELTPATTLDSLNLDSLDTSEFYMEVEEEFEILVEAEWDQCKTVQDVINVIQARI